MIMNWGIDLALLRVEMIEERVFPLQFDSGFISNVKNATCHSRETAGPFWRKAIHNPISRSQKSL